MKERVIYVNPRPFTFSQNFVVYEEGVEIANTQVPMNILEESIIAYAHQHNVSEINIAGPEIYTKGIQKRMQKVELEKYNKRTGEVEVLELGVNSFFEKIGENYLVFTYQKTEEEKQYQAAIHMIESGDSVREAEKQIIEKLKKFFY